MTADADVGPPTRAEARERADGLDRPDGAGRADDDAVLAGGTERHADPERGVCPVLAADDEAGRVVLRLALDAAALEHVEAGEPLDADGARELAAALDSYAARAGTRE